MRGNKVKKALNQKLMEKLAMIIEECDGIANCNVCDKKEYCILRELRLNKLKNEVIN